MRDDKNTSVFGAIFSIFVIAAFALGSYYYFASEAPSVTQTVTTESTVTPSDTTTKTTKETVTPTTTTTETKESTTKTD